MFVYESKERTFLNILLLSDNPPPLGGAEYHMELLKILFEKKGHKVDFFFFNDYAKNSKKNAAKELEKALVKKKFDIAHIHAIEYYFSDAIKVLSDKNIPIFQTLHDYRYICPTGSCFRNDKTCLECVSGQFYHAAFNGCYSFLGAMKRFLCETALKRDVLHISKITKFISPSLFLKKRFESSCFKGEIEHIYNFLNLEDYKVNYPVDRENPYILFIGRLMPNKGVRSLYEAVKGTGITLRIAGKGPMEDFLKERIKTDKGADKIFLEGFKKRDDLIRLTAGAKLTVVPSEWMEVLGFVVLESFALGRPVIGSRIGGIPELLSEDRGVLFEPGNIEELREKLIALFYDDDMLEQMGINGRKFVFENMNEEIYYDKIMKLYNSKI